MVPLALERQAGETQLWVKQVRVGTGKDAQRYIVTLNEAEAKKDKADRQAIIDGLQTQLKKGDKALVGNSADRRYLKASGKSFALDPDKLAEEARFDGIIVLAHQCPHHPASGGEPLPRSPRGRGVVPDGQGELFPPARLSINPDAAIRGHVFVSLLALTLAKEVTWLRQGKGFQPEWQPLLYDLDRLRQARIDKDGKLITTRTQLTGEVDEVCKAAGIALFGQHRRAASGISRLRTNPPQTPIVKCSGNTRAITRTLLIS
jgi:hypothetical protein